MALINLKLYDDLEKNMQKAKQNNEKYSVRIKRIKKDLKKRKRGWTARIVILSFWLVLVVALTLIATGIVEIGGASAVVGSGEVPEYEPPVSLAMLPALFVPATWTLCFVGFPIGWNWQKDDRQKAKNELYVQHTVYEDGRVDTYTSTLVPKLTALIGSFFMGALTMVFSVPIAIVQCFTWRKHIKRIKGILSEVESNPLFVCI